MHLRIATCRPLPEPDVDEDVLLAALRAHGVDAHMAAWNDAEVAWDDPVPTVIRSTWDYLHDVAGFLAWAERAATAAPLWNAPAVVRWNVHKGYLAELARAGHDVVPTEHLARGARADLAVLAARHGWRDVVVKPAVSAGSFATRRFRLAPRDARSAPPDEANTEAQRFLDESLAARDVLVQPYVDSVDDHGERSLVWIDGAFTHSIRKTPRFSGDDERVSGALDIDADALSAAQAVLETARARVGELLYARVDLARDESGRPMVMELELIEPSLFLKQSPAALERLARALARRVSTSAR